MLKQYLLISGFFITTIILGSCARVGSPLGGPMDTIPPQLVYSEPGMYATKFDGAEIELVFDEYIQLNNVNTELIVSPPVEEKPQVKLRNRSVLVDLNNDLRDSVTYTLNFGDAIVDNNERNPISGFEFVFSTGNHIDSFSVAGNLVNSFTLQPYEDEIHVMLYENLADSAPYKTLPAFIGKVTPEGNFAINNVKSDTFRIFALKDANNNLRYDLPNEQIAFYDTAVHLSPKLFQNRDTIVVDSTLIETLTSDTISAVADTLALLDTAEVRKTLTFYTPLFMFQEDNERQYLVEDNRDDKHRLRMIFNTSVDSIGFKALNVDQDNWYLPEFSENRDTFDLWLADTTLAENDSILLEVSHFGLDTVQNKVWKTDTILFKYTEKEISSRRGKEKKEERETVKPPSFLNTNLSNKSTMELNASVRISSKYPITGVDTSGIHFTWMEDSIIHKAPFTFVADTFPDRHFHLTTKWKDATPYELFIEPNTFSNIYHYPHDTIQVSFKTRAKDYYGTAIFDVKNVPHDVIIQFFSGEKMIRQQVADADGTVTFDYLAPQEYQVKVIYDSNENGKWDTGDYLTNVQPERVDYYPEKISVRSNWEIEYEWDMKK